MRRVVSRILVAATLAASVRRDGRQLAALARPSGDRRQHREGSAGALVGHRERGLEAADAGALGIDADHLGAPRLPQRRRRRRPLVVGGRSRRGDGAVEEAAGRRERRHPQAEHVVAVAGDRRQAGVGAHRHRRGQGVRLRRQGAVDARRGRRSRQVRSQLGLRVVAAPGRRPDRGPGAPRHEDRRSVLPARARRRDRRRALARRAADRRQGGVARRLHHAGAAGDAGRVSRSW